MFNLELLGGLGGGALKTGYIVRDVMTINPVVVEEDFTIKKCVQILSDLRLGSLIVVGKGQADKPVKEIKGIITEGDLVRKTILKDIDPKTTQVKKIMTKDVISISPSKDVTEAIELMNKHNIRHLPVVEGKRLVGFLTLKDILRIAPELFDLVVERIKLREEYRKPLNKEFVRGNCEICGEYSEHLLEVKGQLLCTKCRIDIL